MGSQQYEKVAEETNTKLEKFLVEPTNQVENLEVDNYESQQDFQTDSTGEIVLYPGGKDKFGRSILTNEDSEDAEMKLDYFDQMPEDFTSGVQQATPDIPDVKKLGKSLVKLDTEHNFIDRILPPLIGSEVKNKQFSTSYFVNLHYRVRQGGTYNYAFFPLVRQVRQVGGTVV